MMYLYAFLIFNCGVFVGMILTAFFSVARDADEYDAHTDYRGEK
jgi:hypothetical protein